MDFIPVHWPTIPRAKRAAFIPLVVVIIVTCVATRSPIWAKKLRFETGYLVAMATCTPSTGKRYRILITSDFFAYCPGENSREGIARDKDIEIREALRVLCDGSVSLDHAAVETWSSHELAEKNRSARETNGSFQKKARIGGWGKYSNSCE